MARQQVADFNKSTRVLGPVTMSVDGGGYSAGNCQGLIYLPPVGDSVYELHSISGTVFPASLPASGTLLGYYVAILTCRSSGQLSRMLGLADFTFQDFPGDSGELDLKWMRFSDQYSIDQDFTYPIETKPGEGLVAVISAPYATGDATGTPTWNGQAALSVRGKRMSILGIPTEDFKLR